MAGNAESKTKKPQEPKNPPPDSYIQRTMTDKKKRPKEQKKRYKLSENLRQLVERSDKTKHDKHGAASANRPRTSHVHTSSGGPSGPSGPSFALDAIQAGDVS